MNEDNQQEQLDFVRQRVQSGYSDDQIKNELIIAGYTDENIEQLMMAYNQAFIVEPHQVLDSSTNPKKTKAILLAKVFLILLITSVLSYTGYSLINSMTNSNKSATVEIDGFDLFEDPNFTIQIPTSWGGDAGNNPGQTPVFFYSPEDSVPETYDQAAFITITSEDGKKREEFINTIKNDENIVVHDDKFTKKDGVMKNFIEFTIDVGGNNIIRTTIVFSVLNDSALMLLVQVNEDYWDKHKDQVEVIVNSFNQTSSTIE